MSRETGGSGQTHESLGDQAKDAGGPAEAGDSRRRLRTEQAAGSSPLSRAPLGGVKFGPGWGETERA